MGKHEPMTAKAIANKIKAKGLQKIKYYCQMCKKQCRDDNGFKCHIMSDAHRRQASIVYENPDQFVDEFSKEFLDGFMFILKARYRSKRILANTVFQEYIKDKQHIHLNGTRWTSLTEFATWLGDRGMVTVEESERGVLITYIDRDPETLKKQELDAKRALLAKEAAERNQMEIERQMAAAKDIYARLETEPKPIEPVPIVKLQVKSDNQVEDPGPMAEGSNSTTVDTQTKIDPDSNTPDVIERPLFHVQAISLKPNVSTGYRPPPPKRKVIKKDNNQAKKARTGT